MGVNMGHAPDQGLANHPVDKLNLLQHKKFREHKKQQKQRAGVKTTIKRALMKGEDEKKAQGEAQVKK